MTIPQPRSGNGQFAEFVHAPAPDDIALPQPKQGSFLFPPILRNAEEAIAFYEHVEIPDEVCQKVRSEYEAQWQVAVDYGPEGVWELVRVEREKDGLPADDQARAEFVVEWRQKMRDRPETLDVRDVRAAARVIGLAAAASHLPEEDRNAVAVHPIETTGGDLTTREYHRSLGLAYISNAVTDPDSYKEVDAEEILAALQDMEDRVGQRLNTIHAELDETVRETGATVIDVI